MTPATLDVVIGTDFTFPVRISPRQSISAWTVQWKALSAGSPIVGVNTPLWTPPPWPWAVFWPPCQPLLPAMSSLILDNASVGGITALDLVNGIFQVTIPAALTAMLAPDIFQWTFQRIDSGLTDVYAYGSMYLKGRP